MRAGTVLSQLRDEEYEAKKHHLIESARPLFERKSFYEISMKDIASEVGVSSASMYRFFTTLDDLFVDALELDVINLDRDLEGLLSKGASCNELGMAVLDYFMDNESAFQMVCHFLIINGLSERTRNRFCDLHGRFLKMFDDKLERSGDGYDSGFSVALIASLAGTILTFRNYPGLGLEEKRQVMHRVSILITHEEVISAA